MGRRGDAMRAAKKPAHYYAGALNAQVDRLRTHFTSDTEDLSGPFNVAVDRLYRRLSKFYGYDNKYMADGRLRKDVMAEAKEAAYVGEIV